MSLRTLQLVVTDKVPPEKRELAEATLKRLPIGADPRIIKKRRTLYELYRGGTWSLQALRHHAPLLAAAIEKDK